MGAGQDQPVVAAQLCNSHSSPLFNAEQNDRKAPGNGLSPDAVNRDSFAKSLGVRVRRHTTFLARSNPNRAPKAAGGKLEILVNRGDFQSVADLRP
jgi:hypothetical protein